MGRDDAMTDLETFPTHEAPKQCLVCVERDEVGSPYVKQVGEVYVRGRMRDSWLMACGKCGWEWRVVK